MANGLITDGVTQVATSGANKQIVDPVASTTASTLGILGNTAIEGYKEYVFYDADKRSQEAVAAFNKDLGDIQNNQLDIESMNRSLQKAADINPDVQKLVSDLGNLTTAIQQRKGAALLYRLRAEDALKQTLAKAPGLRSEVTRIAANNLGFDPTAGTVSMLLRGIESEREKEVDNADLKQRWTYLAGELNKLGVQGIQYPSDGNFGGAIPKLENKIDLMHKAQGDVDNIQNKIKEGEINEKVGIQQLIASTNTYINEMMTPRLQAAITLLQSAGTEEEIKIADEKLRVGIEGVRLQAEAFLSRQYSSLSLTPEGAAELRNAHQQTIAGLTSGIQSILDSKDLTTTQQQVRTLSMLTEKFGLDVFQSTKALEALKKAFPGTGEMLLGIMMSNKEAESQVRRVVAGSLQNLSDAQLMSSDLGNFLDVVKDPRSFDNLSSEGRRKVAVDSINGVKEINSKFRNKPEALSDEDIINHATMYATAMQLSNEFVTSDWESIAIINQSPLFLHMVDRLWKMGGDNRVKAAVLYDTNIRSQSNYLNNISADVIKDATAEKSMFNLKPNNIVFDYSTGEAKAYAAGTTNPARNNSPAGILARKFNDAVESIYATREHDASLAKLTKPQIAVLYGQKLINNPNVQRVGTRPTMPQSEAEREEIKFEDLVKELDGQLKSVSATLGSGKISPEMEKLLGTLGQVVNRSKQLREGLGVANNVLENEKRNRVFRTKEEDDAFYAASEGQ